MTNGSPNGCLSCGHFTWLRSLSCDKAKGVDCLKAQGKKEEGIEDLEQYVIPAATSGKPDGARGKGTITRLERGKVKDFIEGEALKKWRDPEAGCLQLTVATDDGHEIRKLLTLSSSVNSSIQKFKVLYGDLKVGVHVETVYSLGFERIRL